MRKKHNPIDGWFLFFIIALGFWWVLAGGESTPASEIQRLQTSTDPEVWIRALGCEDREVRNYARENILETLPPESLEQIAVEASQSGIQSSRLAGLWLLSQVDAEGRGAIAAQYLYDQDSGVIEEALKVLAEDPVEGSRDRIIELINNSRNEVKATGLRALAAIENPEDTALFISNLGMSNSDVREAAKYGILRLAPVHPDIVTVLLGAARGDDLSAARESLGLLGQIGGEGALNGLFMFLEFGPIALASDAAGAIGEIGGQETAVRALDLYLNASGRIRAQAARVLEVIGLSEARDPLWATVQDESREFWLRHHSMEALATCGDESMVMEIVEWLSDPARDTRIVRIGIEALGGIGGDEVLDIYDLIIAGEVDFGLDYTGGQTALIAAVEGLGRMDTDESRERLRTLLETTDPESFDILIAIVQSLGSVGTREDIETLMKLEEGKPVLHTFVINAVTAIDKHYSEDVE